MRRIISSSPLKKLWNILNGVLTLDRDSACLVEMTARNQALLGCVPFVTGWESFAC